MFNFILGIIVVFSTVEAIVVYWLYKQLTNTNTKIDQSSQTINNYINTVDNRLVTIDSTIVGLKEQSDRVTLAYSVKRNGPTIK